MSKYIHQQQNKINDLEVKIEELKTENKKLKQQLKDNTKQVCADERKRVVGEIKEKFKENLIDWYEDEDNANKELYLDADELWIILDQIENEKESN